jgi:hypothetical protein
MEEDNVVGMKRKKTGRPEAKENKKCEKVKAIKKRPIKKT